MNTREIWRSVPSLPSALASNHGRVMAIPFHSDSPRAGRKQYGGMPTYGVWDGTRFLWRFQGKNYKVARLICEAFNGPPSKDKSVCMHLDENARNNTPANLAWGTQKENLNAPGFLAYCRSRTGDKHPHNRARKRLSQQEEVA